MQLDLFIDKNNPQEIRLNVVEDKCEKVRLSADNVRRGLFARHNELAKMYLELKEKYEILSKEIEQVRHASTKTVYIYGANESGNLFESRTDVTDNRILAQG